MGSLQQQMTAPISLETGGTEGDTGIRTPRCLCAQNGNASVARLIPLTASLVLSNSHGPGGTIRLFGPNTQPAGNCQRVSPYSLLEEGRHCKSFNSLSRVVLTPISDNNRCATPLLHSTYLDQTNPSLTDSALSWESVPDT